MRIMLQQKLIYNTIMFTSVTELCLAQTVRFILRFCLNKCVGCKCCHTAKHRPSQSFLEKKKKNFFFFLSCLALVRYEHGKMVIHFYFTVVVLFVFLFPHCHLYFRIQIFIFKALFCSGILSDVHLYLNLQKSCQTWVMSRILSIKRNLSFFSFFFSFFFSIDAKSCHCEYTLMVVILDG